MTIAEAVVSDEVLVQSKVLGPLEVPSAQIYRFPQEMYGLPGARDFALLPAERDGFFWLQSVEFDALTFLAIDPFAYVDGYSVEVGSQDLGPVASDDASELMVLAILSLPRQPGDRATVNLQGPVVLNVVRKLGKQVVVESPQGMRVPVDLTRAA